MNSKPRSILTLMFASQLWWTPEITPVGGTSKAEFGNIVLTCFKPGCSKHRKGNNLYCSAKCCKEDRDRVKQRLTRKGIV